MHKPNNSKTIVFPILSALVTLAFACSSPTPDVDLVNDTSDQKSGKSSSSGSNNGDDDDKSTSSSSSSSSGGSSSGGTEPKDCSGENDIEACANCCGYNESIEQTFIKADEVYITCACNNKCASACGNTCTDPWSNEPTQACLQCLDEEAQFTKCAPEADAVCDSDSACQKFVACLDESACFDKAQ